MGKKEARKFTFVYPDFEYNYTKKGINAEPGGWYHEGIAQLSAIIEDLGWKVSLIHLTKPVTRKQFQNELKQHNPTILGFSVRTGVAQYAKDLIEWAKGKSKMIIVGSYHPTLWPEEVINWGGVDAICIGEGETPIKILIENINNKKSILNIGSLWVKGRDGKIYKNKVLPMITDFNKLPLPKFDIFDFSKLIASQIKASIIVLTRGCPFNCTYCWNNFARSLYPNKHQYVRYRSPENCIKYLKKIIQLYPDVKSFRFQDDLWPFYNDWFKNFSGLYKNEINLPFECHLRANLLTEDIIKELKSMKCFGIYFGVESGNEEIRNNVLKRAMTEEVLLKAFKVCKKYGIRTHSYNIVGLPYENMAKVLDTIKLNAHLEPTDMFFPVFFPYAGTELYDIAVKSGFFDPSKPFDPYVNIEMPDFKKKQIRFASLYSKTFVRVYQKCFKLPVSISKVFEKIIDKLWLFPYWPFTILNAWIVLKRNVENKIKTFIKVNFYSLYLVLKK